VLYITENDPFLKCLCYVTVSLICLPLCAYVYIIVLKGIVGEVEKDAKSFYMWTHKKLDIGYNEDAIVDVNLTSEAKVILEPGARISFTYEVRFNMYYNLHLFTLSSVYFADINMIQ